MTDVTRTRADSNIRRAISEQSFDEDRIELVFGYPDNPGSRLCIESTAGQPSAERTYLRFLLVRVSSSISVGHAKSNHRNYEGTTLRAAPRRATCPGNNHDNARLKRY